MHRFFLTLLVLIFALPAWSQFVAPGGAIPVVANNPGEFGTFWRSDINIRNISSQTTSVTLLLLPELRASGPTFERQVSDPITVPGDGQVTLQNVLTGQFGIRNKKGAVSIFSNDGAPLAIASRTYTNAPEGGTYGLNVYGLLVVGDEGSGTNEAWIAGIDHSDTGFNRTNIGVFLPVDPPVGQSYVFTVTTNDGDGLQIAQGSMTFDQAGLIQRSLSDFGVTEAISNASVTIRCNSADALWYGYATVVDNASQDSVYRPATGRQPASR
jgi:hypothetical protein